MVSVQRRDKAGRGPARRGRERGRRKRRGRRRRAQPDEAKDRIKLRLDRVQLQSNRVDELHDLLRLLLALRPLGLALADLARPGSGLRRAELGYGGLQARVERVDLGGHQSD